MYSDVVINVEQRRRNSRVTVMCYECVNVTHIVTGDLFAAVVWIAVHKMNLM